MIEDNDHINYTKMLKFTKQEENSSAIEFCQQFLSGLPSNRGIFGRNDYAKSIADLVDVSFFVDDFTDEKQYLGKPIIGTEEIPKNALVVSTLLGNPLSGENCLNKAGVKHLNYFAFYENAGLDMPPVRFRGGFQDEYNNNKEKYLWVESLLADEESLVTYHKIINFRLSGNLSYMEGFSDRQKYQYFENFLELKETGEIFVDVGGFDGYTSTEFIKLCPEYQAIYLFEPNTDNMAVARENLRLYDNVHLYQMGLSSHKETLYFSSEGSVFSANDEGSIEIKLDALDKLVDDEISYIKMDIEGAEGKAIEGARDTILKNHPKLAICVYHKNADFRKIPEQIFFIRDDYDIYLRHYTEGVVETVMFFIPK